jgi:hypothetical protein
MMFRQKHALCSQNNNDVQRDSHLVTNQQWGQNESSYKTIMMFRAIHTLSLTSKEAKMKAATKQ